jgi:hypothetical protein
MYTTRENMKQGVQRAQQQKQARSIEEGLNLQVKEAYSNAKLFLSYGRVKRLPMREKMRLSRQSRGKEYSTGKAQPSKCIRVYLTHPPKHGLRNRKKNWGKKRLLDAR